MQVKAKLGTIEFLISSALVDSFALVNNVLREYNDMKKENEKLNTATGHKRF